jgi:hypothetical protein
MRQTAIHALFEEAGCQVEEQRVSRNSANVICKLRGESDSTIVVGGHWSGTALLPSLYETLKRASHHHTYVFVAFAEEETGLEGSSRYVKEFSKEERLRVRAFVNLECLGLGPRAMRALVDRLAELAGSIHVPIGEIHARDHDSLHHAGQFRNSAQPQRQIGRGPS